MGAVNMPASGWQAANSGRRELARYVCLTHDLGTGAGVNRFQTA